MPPSKIVIRDLDQGAKLSDTQMRHVTGGSGSRSELESLRLQMNMDRESKAMTTLSNVLKKTSDTSQSITQNLK